MAILRETLRLDGIGFQPVLGAVTQVGKGRTPDDAVKRLSGFISLTGHLPGFSHF